MVSVGAALQILPNSNIALQRNLHCYLLHAPLCKTPPTCSRQAACFISPNFRTNQNSMQAKRELKSAPEMRRACIISRFLVFFVYKKWGRNPKGWRNGRPVVDITARAPGDQAPLQLASRASRILHARFKSPMRQSVSMSNSAAFFRAQRAARL